MNRLAAGVAFVALGVQCLIAATFAKPRHENILILTAMVLALIGFFYLTPSLKDSLTKGDDTTQPPPQL